MTSTENVTISIAQPNMIIDESSFPRIQYSFNDDTHVTGPSPNVKACGDLYLTASVPYVFSLKALPTNAFTDAQKRLYKVLGSDMKLISENSLESPHNLDIVAVPKKAFAQSYTTYSKEIDGYNDKGGLGDSVQSGVLTSVGEKNIIFRLESLGDEKYKTISTGSGQYLHLLPPELTTSSTHSGSPGKNYVLTLDHNLPAHLFTSQWLIHPVENGLCVIQNRGTGTCLHLQTKEPPFVASQFAVGQLNVTDESALYKNVKFINHYGLPVYRIIGSTKLEDALRTPQCQFRCDSDESGRC